MSIPTPGESDRTSGRRSPGALLFVAAALVGGFLLFGAFAKVYTEATREAPTWPVGPLAHAAFETVVALALLALRRRALAWLAVGALFAFFAGVTMHRLLGGYPSCGCFGKFAVPPPVTLTLDALIVATGVALAQRVGAGRSATAWFAAAVLPLAVGGSVYSLRTSDPPPRAFDLSKIKAAAESQSQGGATPHLSPPAVGESSTSRATREEANRAAAGMGAGSAATSESPAPAATQAPAPVPPPSRPPQPAAPQPRQAGVDATAQQALLLVPAAAEKALAGSPAPKPEWLARLAEAVGDTDPAQSGGRAWLLFIYDPDCHVCQTFIPAYEQHERFDSREPGAPLRIVMIRKADLDAEAMGDARIPDWAWPASPTVVLVRSGAIIHEWGGEAAPYPKVLHAEIAKGGAAYLDGLAKTHKVLTP